MKNQEINQPQKGKLGGFLAQARTLGGGLGALAKTGIAKLRLTKLAGMGLTKLGGFLAGPAGIAVTALSAVSAGLGALKNRIFGEMFGAKKEESGGGIGGDISSIIPVICVVVVGLIFLFSLFSFSSTITNFTARPHRSTQTASPSATPSLILEP